MAKKLIEKKIPSLCRARPCMLITTLHANGVVNAGTFGAYTNVGPEEIGIAIGRASDTYRNIKRTGEFVINVPNIDELNSLEICAKKIPDNESELDRAGMSTEAASKIKTPLIRECVVNIECEVWREIEIARHYFIIGKTLCGHLDERFIASDGGLDVVKSKVAFSIAYPKPIYATLDESIEVDLSAF